VDELGRLGLELMSSAVDAPSMAMRRGFMASGISRTSSISSRPLSKAALFTCT